MASPLNQTARLLFARSRRAVKPEIDPYDLEAGAEFKSIKRSENFRLARESKNMLLEIVASIPNQLFELQILLRPLALVVVPFLWIIYRLSSGENLIWSLATISLKTAFNLVMLLSLSILFLVCTWLAKEYLTSRSKEDLLRNLRSSLRYSLDGAGNEIFSQTLALLGDGRSNKFAKNTQKIGYKSKLKGLDQRVQRFPNRDEYQGEFFQGKNYGSGVYTFHMRGKYEGDWVDGKFDGHGVETWDAGSIYRGQYKRGARDGCGVYRFDNGDEYSGEWANGHCHGYGVQKCSDGSKYVGQFRSGSKHGFGFYYFGNGDTYSGEYIEDKLGGYGVYKFAEGHVYEGSWHDGNKEGHGVYTINDGEAHAGLWKDDALHQPTSPNSTSATRHTTNLWTAVQEARKAATKAMDLPRIHDVVNKAVATANMAANAARIAALKAAQKKNHLVVSPDLEA